MNIHRIDTIIIDDRAQTRTGKCDFCMRVFSLQKIGVVSGCKCILSEIIQTQQCTKSYSAHASFYGTLLGVDTIRIDTFVACQMKCFIFIGIIGLLEDSYIISATCMQIRILIRVHRIDFKSDHFEIFSCDLAGISDVFHCGFVSAFSGQDQNLLQACLSDRLHFFFNLAFI